MPRPIWSGAISFGLVSIPVKLFNAVQRKSVSFNQLDSRDNQRIRYRKVNAEDEDKFLDRENMYFHTVDEREYDLS